jgi:hypothetical protein
MKASKWRRLANFAVDSSCIVFLFLALLRLLPTGLVAVNYYRFVVLGIMFSYYILAELLFKRTLGKLFTSTHIVTTSDDVWYLAAEPWLGMTDYLVPKSFI